MKTTTETITEDKPAENSGSSEIISDGSHLAALIAEDKEAEDQAAVDQAETDGTGPALKVESLNANGLFTFEAFKAGFSSCLYMSGHMTGLETLVISPDAKTFPKAAAAIYDTLLDTPSLHFLLRPGGKWIMRLTAIGMFIVPVGAGCLAEIKARRFEVAEPEPADNQEPEQAQDLPTTAPAAMQPESVNEAMVKEA